jgi:hypothetical protein
MKQYHQDRQQLTWCHKPRYLCGFTASFLFSIIAFYKHYIAWGSSITAIIHHIIFPSSYICLNIDMFFNFLTLCVFLPKLILYCQLNVICSALNFFIHRDKRNTELEHILQVTLPCCLMALTYS